MASRAPHPSSPVEPLPRLGGLILRTLLLVLATLPLALAPPPAGASHCDFDGDPALGIVEFTDGSGRVFYLADARGEWWPGPLHLYEETNGIYAAGGSPFDNLQRDYMKGTDLVPDDWYPCATGPWLPDTLIL